MPFTARYRCEFDTIKGRSVKVDIERDIPTTINITGVLSIFEATGDYVTIFDDLRYLQKGDIITISNTVNNNGTFSIKEIYYSNYPTPYTVIEFNESIIDETDTTFVINVDTISVKNIIASSQSPLEIQYPNGEFEKMCPIRESKIRLKILADNVSANDFYVEEDTQYKIKIYINNTLEWVGWLDNNILTQPFLDTATEIELSGNDGLSLLKTKNLVSSIDEQIWSGISINNLFAVALYHTKLELNYSTFINMYNAGSSIRSNSVLTDIFNNCYVYSHTFLKGPRDFDDCYEVLSKIMQSFGCTLFQARGQWYIIQTNDRIANLLDGTNRDFEGTELSISLNQNFKINIGLNEITKLINADALESIEKPFKEVSLKYKFERPPIFFRNWDLLDGILDISKSTPTRQIYEAQYWLPPETWNLIIPGQINVNQKGYIAADIDTVTNSEKRRYLVLYSSNNNETATKTTRYPVSKGDIIEVGFRARLNIVCIPNRTIVYKCIVKLIGNNGTNYYLDGGTAKWDTNRKALIKFHDTNVDTRLWSDFFGGKAQAIPVDGLIEFEFTSHGTPPEYTNTNNWEVHFTDLTLEINASFNDLITVDGFEQKSENDKKIRNKYDNDLFLCISPNISNSGALLSSVSVPTSITSFNYKNSATNLTFLQYMTRAYWRTMFRQFMRIEGRLYDLYQGNRLLSPLNTVEFTEVNDKEFMVTTLQMDIRQESAEFTMIELRTTANNSDFTENGIESFRYTNVKAKDLNDPLKEPRYPIDWRFGIFGVIQSLNRTKKMRRFNNYQ